MIDYQNRVKVVDGVLLLKKVNSSTDTLITENTPDANEVMFYADQDGNLKIKNQAGDNEVGGSSVDLGSPGPIGENTPSTFKGTTGTFSDTVSLTDKNKL